MVIHVTLETYHTRSDTCITYRINRDASQNPFPTRAGRVSHMTVVRVPRHFFDLSQFSSCANPTIKQRSTDPQTTLGKKSDIKMRYPDYYLGDVKEVANESENAEAELQYSDRLRFSAHTNRQSIDENSAALKDSNHRYSGASRERDQRLSKGSWSRQSHPSCRESAGSSSHRNSTSTKGNRRQTTVSNTSQSQSSKTSRNTASEKTIALFGVNGVTGNYFLQLAVEAGYQVRALILPGFELEDMQANPNLTLIYGTLDDDAKIHRVIRKAAYVVCMLNDFPQSMVESASGSTPIPSNFDFIRKLASSPCKVLLYQVSYINASKKRNIFSDDDRPNLPATILYRHLRLRLIRKDRLP